MAALYIDTDHVVSLDALKTEAGDVVTGATVQMTLLDAAGDEVAGQSWPVSLTEDDPGDYSAQLSEEVDVALGDDVTVRVVATSGARKATWWSTRTVQRRVF